MREFYTIREASEYLEVKVRTIRNWIAVGKLKAAKFPSSRRWVIPKSELERVKGERTK